MAPLHVISRVILYFIALYGFSGCGVQSGSKEEAQIVSALPQPSPTQSAQTSNEISRNADIPQFASNTPFGKVYESPIQETQKKLWARSILWEKAPELIVEKWISEPPLTTGKFILIEFWATWCSQCRKSIPDLNRFHEKFKDDLVVIGVSDEPEDEVRSFTTKIDYFSAIDTQGRMKEELGVFGIPHAILIEPGGYVVWEGFPLLHNYELTDEVIEKVLKTGKEKKSSR